MAYPDLPHIELPVRFDPSTRRLAALEQDSIDEVTQNVSVVLRCQPGAREDEPDFGVPEQVFLERGVDLEEIARHVEEWEPRARLLLDRDPSSLTELVDMVGIEVDLEER